MMLGSYPSLTLFQHLSPDFPAVDLILVRCSGTTSNQGGRRERTIVGPLMFLAVLLLVLVSRFYLQPTVSEVIPGHKGEELFNAAESDKKAEVLSLLQKGADPNGFNDPPVSGNP